MTIVRQDPERQPFSFRIGSQPELTRQTTARASDRPRTKRELLVAFKNLVCPLYFFPS